MKSQEGAGDNSQPDLLQQTKANKALKQQTCFRASCQFYRLCKGQPQSLSTRKRALPTSGVTHSWCAVRSPLLRMAGTILSPSLT